MKVFIFVHYTISLNLLSLNTMNTKFIHTYVSVDCVIFGFDNKQLNILLVQQSKNKVKDLKLPGSLIYDNEDVDNAANRILFELTGIKKMSLRQFRCFASPERASNPQDIKWLDKEYHPHINRLITVAFLAICRIDKKLNNISKYRETQWISVDKIPQLPFDHNKIVGESLCEIRRWVEFDPAITFESLSNKFTIGQLHKLYEAIYYKEIDIRNFHKKVRGIPYILALAEKQGGVSHRAARLHKFDKKIYNKLRTNI